MGPCERCPCGGHYEHRSVEVRFADAGVLLPDLPQKVCPACGSRVYPREILERVEAAYRGDEIDPAVARVG